MKKMSVIFIAMLFLFGCTATLPQKVEISPTYSLQGLKLYTLKLDCEKANLDPSFNKSFASTYCHMLDSNIKLTLQKSNPEFRFAPSNSDLNIEVTLEELHGGSAAARFWVGFGAGRTVSTVYVRILKGQELQAEGRVTETTAFTYVIADSNEDAVLQDIPRVARKVAEFVNDPVKFKNENQP